MFGDIIKVTPKGIWCGRGHFGASKAHFASNELDVGVGNNARQSRQMSSDDDEGDDSS